MPPKRQRVPTIFRNTEAELITVDANYLEPGKVYLIQHKKEGLASLTRRNPDTTKYVTRFKGTFVRHDAGRSSRFPEGIPGPHVNPSTNFVVFENVQILSNPDKTEFTEGIYVIKPNGQAFDMVSLGNSNKAMRGFIQQGNAVAFVTSNWMFSDSTKSEVISRTEEGTLRQMGNYVNPYDTTTEQQNMTNLRARAMDVAGPQIAAYLGKPMPTLQPLDASLGDQMPEGAAWDSTDLGLKNEVDGGRGKRRRKSRKSRQSRKKRTIKRRRNYRK